jgi:hypothetical protein
MSFDIPYQMRQLASSLPYSRKIAPTVSIIHKEIKDSIKISKSKLTLTLIDFGYTYKKIGDNRRVLYDQVSQPS